MLYSFFLEDGNLYLTPVASSANKTFTFGRRELDKGINAKIFHLAFQFMGGESEGEDSVLPPVKLRKFGPNLIFLLPVTGEYLFSMELPPLPVILRKQGGCTESHLSHPPAKT